MHRLLALSVLCVLAACAEPPPPRAPEPKPEPEPAPSAPASAAPATPSAAPRAESPADAAPPPLSSPNAPALKTDAKEPEAPAGDPRTAGIRRIGVAAQDCHARHALGIKGRLTLRIAPDQSGAVKSVSVVRARSSKELALPAFETCVLDAVKKERLSPARDEDDELELPLTFEPNH